LQDAIESGELVSRDGKYSDGEWGLWKTRRETVKYSIYSDIKDAVPNEENTDLFDDYISKLEDCGDFVDDNVDYFWGYRGIKYTSNNVREGVVGLNSADEETFLASQEFALEFMDYFLDLDSMDLENSFFTYSRKLSGLQDDLSEQQSKTVYVDYFKVDACSAPCGVGSQIRVSSCVEGAFCGGEGCVVGDSYEQTRACNTQACCVPSSHTYYCGEGSWANWVMDKNNCGDGPVQYCLISAQKCYNGACIGPTISGRGCDECPFGTFDSNCDEYCRPLSGAPTGDAKCGNRDKVGIFCLGSWDKKSWTLWV